ASLCADLPSSTLSQNRQHDIDRKTAENDCRINVKAELEIELLHEKIDQLREREVLKLTETVMVLTELQQQSASHARIRFESRTAVITRGYRLHGVMSFPIRRAEFHPSRYVVSGNLSPLLRSRKRMQ